MPDTFVALVGNLTDDPEVRFTPQGTTVASFRLAVTPPRQRRRHLARRRDVVLPHQRLARPGRARGRLAVQGRPRPGPGPAQDPLLGDPGGGAPQRGRGRGGRPLAEVGHRSAPARQRQGRHRHRPQQGGRR